MMDNLFQLYQRKQIAELRPYIPGETLDHVSISTPDKEAGSPKAGDMIARNPKNHADQWLVARTYFEDNFAILDTNSQENTELGSTPNLFTLHCNHGRPLHHVCGECPVGCRILREKKIPSPTANELLIKADKERSEAARAFMEAEERMKVMQPIIDFAVYTAGFSGSAGNHKLQDLVADYEKYMKAVKR